MLSTNRLLAETEAHLYESIISKENEKGERIMLQRTRIQDLPVLEKELTEEEARKIAGGYYMHCMWTYPDNGGGTGHDDDCGPVGICYAD